MFEYVNMSSNNLDELMFLIFLLFNHSLENTETRTIFLSFRHVHFIKLN